MRFIHKWFQKLGIWRGGRANFLAVTSDHCQRQGARSRRKICCEADVARGPRITPRYLGYGVARGPQITPRYSGYGAAKNQFLKPLVYILLWICFSSLLLASDKPAQRAIPKQMTTSVLIPCTAFHFHLLKPLLESYAQQTCLPDEISISLSECRNLNHKEISQLERGSWPFRLNLFRHSENKTAGENRNWAKALSRGDILICQDADDLPHPQRVEIVKYIFEHFEIDHLIHSWAPGGEFTPYDKEIIPLFLSTPLQIFEGFREGDRLIPLHNGNICLSRELAQQMRWDYIADGKEDVRFNQKVYKITRQTFLTPLGLIHYVEGKSYFRDREF